MDIKDIRLKKGMSKDDVNELVSEWLLLEDEIYMGNSHQHNWRCRCGNIIENRMWATIRRRESSEMCTTCGRMPIRDKHKYEIEKCGEYKYLKTLYTGDILPNGRMISKTTFVKIKHKYCGHVYCVEARCFIDKNHRCQKCCGSYESSFAHHIEVELGEPLEKYWDFEKNTVNPYHISKYHNGKVWIKCQEKDYHGSYEKSCNDFIDNKRCSYCYGKKVHPKDSFAQYHIDNTDPNFLEKYWDYEKNTVDPFGIKPNTATKLWIKCNNETINKLNGLMKKEYHESYSVVGSDFTRGRRCSYCKPSGIDPKIHVYDSFGYRHLDKIQSCILEDKKSLFEIVVSSKLEYKFKCDTCGTIFIKRLSNISYLNQWCPECSMSEGEKEIVKWLRYNGVNYIYEQEFEGLLGIGKRSLSYDFYLPDFNLLIEYQGEQHDKFIKGIHRHKGKFLRQREHDKRKKEYAKDNNIRLLEIWYWDFDEVESILNKEIKYM